MWTNTIKNTELRKGHKGLLMEALDKYRLLQRDYRIPEIRQTKLLYDKYGKTGIDIGQYILVAKNSPYGDIVSVNKTIWKKGKDIIIYLKSGDNFYLYDISEIKETQENKRGDSAMINFDIAFGVNIKKYFGEKSEEEKLQEFSRQVL